MGLSSLGRSSMMAEHILVLGDQLTERVGPLFSAEPDRARVLMIESRELAAGLPHHKQKLMLVFSAMRHFAQTLRERGFDVSYLQAANFATGIREYLDEFPGAELVVMRPTDWGVEREIVDAAVGAGAHVNVVDNELWLTSDAEFDAWAEGRKSLRLEYFYRSVRKARGWLMDGDKPVGGRWNYDAENRQVPGPGHDFPSVAGFEPDALTLEARAQVDATWPDHFGDTRTFAWPVTREQAVQALEDFVEHRLASFGPYEDAMVEGEDVLYHSLLSVPLNLGLLHPREVCERALAHAADSLNGVPLASIEGFIRQVLGWREFMRHIYRIGMPHLREANGLDATRPLPNLYWSGSTRMTCLQRSVDQIARTGHAHHIQRLMVLGNFALVAGVDPRELNDWFLATFVDALDWVVTPNVMGMSQFADLGSFTSKPYAASGKYIDRMSNYCASCAYDVKSVDGDNSCPMNSLYWSFIDRHRERWVANHRMAVIARGWAKRDPEAKARILARAGDVLERLSDNTL